MQTTAVVIGAGHAGLAMSRRLTDRSIDHVVLKRGEEANSWRTQRWPSLRLLTPNWQTRLPGYDCAGDDPDGFMPVADVVVTLTPYARHVSAPVRTGTTVRTVRAVPQGFEIHASDDLLRAPAVVLATGACTLPAIRPSPMPSQRSSRRSPRLPTATQLSSPTAGFSSSAPQLPASSSPARSAARAAR
jgi:putative flavoprotein involved in K+ transport